MPNYLAPRSDIARLTFLQRSITSGNADREAGNNYLSQETSDEITTFLIEFEAAFDNISDSQSTRTREMRQRNEALAQLEMYVRDLWEVLRRRVRRLQQPAEVHTFYRLPLDGVNPKSVSATEWLILAADVIRGDGEAVAAGYPAMSNPSAQEVEEILTVAQTEAGQADAADRIFDQAQETLADLRVRADRLIEDVMAELRFTLRRKDAPGQRRIMRTYGATFEYLTGEPRDQDDQPAEA